MSSQLSGAGDEYVGFLPEEPNAGVSAGPAWRVLAVDDDELFQRATALALRDFTIFDRPVELLQAGSLAEAARVLARERDIAVILADVVMETDDAGLRLVKGVREMLGFAETRIVLLTGQPGFAPIENVMVDYDISDYCLKSDLAHRGIKNVLVAAVRGYRDLCTLSAARRGLQLILESSNRLSCARGIGELAHGMLVEIAGLLRISPEGIVCAGAADERSNRTGALAGEREPIVIGAAGSQADWIDRPLSHIGEASIRDLIMQAFRAHASIERSDAQVIYFPAQQALAEYVVYVQTPRSLARDEIELLRVFMANVSKGFGNLALIGRLDRLAFEDELLGIPNRSAAIREIERLRISALGRGARLVLIDLDNFGGLNDAFGVSVGNELLKAVRGPLQQAFPPPVFLARLSADLFAVVGDAEAVTMERALEALSQPFRLGGTTLRVSACATQIDLDATDGDGAELLRAARSGLRAAKRRGTGVALAYDPAFEQMAAKRFERASELAGAIAAGELRLVFQPQVALATGRLAGAEALLRWSRCGREISPAEFIPIAEESSLIHAIGEFVVREACRGLCALAEAGVDLPVLGVNISARQFEIPGLVDDIQAICREHGVAPGSLGIEVTETAVMGSFDRVASALQQYRDGGGKVAIDDFGTGMSSLEYLLRLPMDHLKIDRAFVSGLESDERSRQIARLIIEFGRRLGASLIAEGVETQAQAEWLRGQGCHIAQGWHFGRPMGLDAFIAYARTAGRSPGT
ncbi:two-component system response regulator [Cognatazoarcus halotolerans]|uniref:two-component system response regulator n=1 Tax=Cognatazoarcus halotolerans TaxID=2686016 RepID=UPI00135B3FF6|nr:EAL domain-containing protein [Cognatazoarcus halotolerans]MBX3680622.1 EAL domain-containing protein [Rhodocyclaceae bacterium]MCB1898719.1 EAL domain-containing protein [Rhodocyclaceae bacterium]MCP5310461.1 EAL domain-containing protein [Zoogloeaceae bacterium]